MPSQSRKERRKKKEVKRNAVLILLVLLVVIASGVPTHAARFRAFWVDAWGSGFENPTATTNMINYVDACNCNAVIPEMRKRCDAYYTSSYEPVGTSVTPQSGYDCLADIVTKAHNAGLEVHPWVVVYRAWTSQTAPPTTSPNHVFNTHPEWFSLTSSGAKFDADNNSFLDPGHPDVENYNWNVFSEIISNYDVDGFVLDYIRYAGTTWGYNATAVARFNAEYGRTGNPSSTDTTWCNWRRDQVTNMVKRVYLEAKAIKPSIKIGAAVWNSSTTGKNSYFQDWDLWMSSHWLDYASPMAYTTSNTTFNSWVNTYYNQQYGHHIYVAQGSYLNTISNSMTQINYVQNKPMPGVEPYSYRVTNSGTVDREGFKSALLSGPFATYESVPTMSWISSPTYGMLKGFVKDASGQPIYPATVTIQSKSTKNSGTGFYGFVDLSTGTYTVTASATGYNTGSASVTIQAGVVKTVNFTLTPASSNEIIIDNSDSGFSCSSNWSTGTSATDKYGTNYRYRNTQATSDPAKWTPNIPTSGSWAVYAWWSQGTNRSSSAPYIVYYSGGSTTINVNQQTNGGKWNLLTTKTFGTGTAYPTQLSCWTTTGYVVIADAVKWVKQ